MSTKPNWVGIIPPRNRVPSNITKRGFNEPTDRLLGFPTDMLFDQEPMFKDFSMHLDPRRNTMFVRHDLALKFHYESVVYYQIEGEWCSFPVTYTVYRRDRDLLRSEIVDFLRHGSIPARYPLRESGGVINEPMNQENFVHMMSCFCLRNITHNSSFFGEPLPPRIVERLYERGSNHEVQHHHQAFEERFYDSVYFYQYRDPDYFRRADAKRIIDDIRKSGAPYWFVDAEARALALIYRVVAGKDLQLTRGITGI
ncbi:hypothetical protein B0H10DRAFT_1951999 [Mycena sp. CBHHK59/15]|nr:hypothetical protein B0H10DRAFT_1951999 [Mycena sp. CBHHK59/15]